MPQKPVRMPWKVQEALLQIPSDLYRETAGRKVADPAIPLPSKRNWMTEMRRKMRSFRIPWDRVLTVSPMEQEKEMPEAEMMPHR